MAAVGTLSNFARAASDAGRLLGPQGLSRIYRTTRAVRDLSNELSGANRNVWGLASGIRAVGESAGLLGKLADKIRSLRESTRQWLDDLFVVSAGALAAQYEEALWDIRAEAMDTFNQLRHQTLLIQTRLLVDDEQVRQAVQPLAAINVPIEQVRAWAEWSLKVSAATGASAQELATMAADMITFGVRARAAYRVMDKLVGAVQAGYMTMQETVEVLRDSVQLMSSLGKFGDEAFKTFAEGLGLARAALNTMGIPDWQNVFNQFRESIEAIQDFTNEQGQRLVMSLAQFAGVSMDNIRRMAVESTTEYFKLFVQAHINAVQQFVEGWGGIERIINRPWERLRLVNILQEQFGLTREMAMRVVGDWIVEYKKLTKAGVAAQEAQHLALQNVKKSLLGVMEEHEKHMQQQRRLAKLWADFKSQISELTTAFKELGHTFMVSFGTPLLWIGKMVLKIFVTPLKELITLFIELNQRTHGLITYLTTLTIAWITFRKLLLASDLLAWARRAAAAEEVMTKTAAATTAVTSRLDALRQRSKLFDALISGISRAASAIKRRLVPAATAASTAVAETGASALASASLQQKAAKRAAAAIRWVAKVAEETVILQQRVVSGIVASVTTTIPKIIAVLTNPYVLIGTAFVVSMNYFAKHKQEILAWLRDFPQMVHQFITKRLVQTAQDFVAIVPDIVSALTQAVIVAFRELPSVIIQLIPALAKAFFLGGIEAAKALIEGFKENFWGALATTLAIGWFVKAFIAPKLMAALLRFLPGPVSTALSSVFASAGTQAAGVLSRIPFFEPVAAGARHLFDAFESVKRRILRSWSSVDWSKAWKEGKLNLIADKFVQVMKVGFDEVLKQGKLLWSALRAQLLKSKLGQAFVSTVEGGFQKVKDLLTGRQRGRGGAAAPSLAFDVDTKTLKQGLDKAKTLVTRYASRLAKPLSRLGGVVASSLAAALPAISAFASQAMAMLAPLLTNPYVLAGAAVVAGVALLVKYRKKLLEWAKSIGQFITGFIKRLASWVTDLFKLVFYVTPMGILYNMLKSLFPEFIARVEDGLKAMAARVGRLFKALFWEPIAGLGRLVETVLVEPFVRLGETLWDVLVAPFQALVRLIGRVKDWFVSKFQSPIEKTSRFASVVARLMQAVRFALGKIVEQVKKVVEPFLKAWEKVKGVLRKVGILGGKEEEARKATGPVKAPPPARKIAGAAGLVGAIPAPVLEGGPTAVELERAQYEAMRRERAVAVARYAAAPPAARVVVHRPVPTPVPIARAVAMAAPPAAAPHPPAVATAPPTVELQRMAVTARVVELKGPVQLPGLEELRTIPTVQRAAVEQIKETVPTIAERVKEVGVRVVQQAPTVVERIKEVGTAVVQRLIVEPARQLREVAPTVIERVTDLGSKVVERVREVVPTVMERVKEVGVTALQQLRESVPAVTDLGSKVVERVREVVPAAIEKVREVSATTLEPIVRTIAPAAPRLVKATPPVAAAARPLPALRETVEVLAPTWLERLTAWIKPIVARVTALVEAPQRALEAATPRVIVPAVEAAVVARPTPAAVEFEPARRRPGPVPTAVVTTEPVEAESLTRIAQNTDTMVTLLRQIESNTRKAAAIPVAEHGGRAYRTPPAPANPLNDYVRANHI